ncbi:MerR family transcriptional regulator [Streptomyces sp. NPDC052023]|uniref:MerR family transcriptional regulator n=1 Tax=Streptomyces sp. NPDC052023 TaxID=3365681 RepID=UPI0037D0DE9A
MRLAELSRSSGVPTATIKYYVREGLIPPGRRVAATQTEYDEHHVRRLRLVTALLHVGGLQVARAREVLAAAEDESLDLYNRLGAAITSLPSHSVPDETDSSAAAARREVDAVVDRMSWRYVKVAGHDSPAYDTLVSAVAALDRLGYPSSADRLMRYARAADLLATGDLDEMEEFDTPTQRVEAAVVLTVLYEPVLLSLRRLGHMEEARRRYADGPDADC